MRTLLTGCWWCRKLELHSLAGKLQHACKVVQPGRSFLRQVFELLRGAHRDYHYICSDLTWWDLFLDSWNRVSMLHPAKLSSPDHHIHADASGSFGCGPQLAPVKWPQSYAAVAIAPKDIVLYGAASGKARWYMSTPTKMF